MSDVAIQVITLILMSYFQLELYAKSIESLDAGRVIRHDIYSAAMFLCPWVWAAFLLYQST